MAETAQLPDRVSAQTYMKNLMIDGDDEDDVRLHLAALCGDTQGLKEISAEDESNMWINYRVRPYMSPPLRLAVSGGSVDCVRILLSAGADIEVEDVKGQTPLFVATSLAKPDIMEVLLEAGANPEGSVRNRCSPLMIAVRDGFCEGVKLLLKFGADPEPFDRIVTCVPGWPLQHSVVYAHFSCFFELLKGGAVPNLTALPVALKPGIAERLSVPHAIMKYAKDYPEFVQMYYECGGNLRQLSAGGVPSLDEAHISSPAKERLLSLLGMPRSLKSLCRVKIRQLIGRRNLGNLSSLELPSSLIPFLNFEEFSRYALRTKENTHQKLSLNN